MRQAAHLAVLWRHYGCLSYNIMAACVTNSHTVAIGVFRKGVEHAFCVALYASCLFFPLHLS